MAKKVKEKAAIDYEGYLICDHSKLDRVINGIIGSQGQLTGGLGKDADVKAILAEYDKIGGLIRTKDGKKVAMGSFYDFVNKQPRKIPLVEVDNSANKAGLKINTEEVGDKPQRRGRKTAELDKASLPDEE